MYQIFHFLTDSPIDLRIVHRHEVLRIEDANLSTILVWMIIEAQREDNTAEHPDVNLRVDPEFHVLVDHLGRSVHHGGVLLIVLELVLDVLRAGPLSMLQHRLARRSEIAKAECLVLLVKKYVLDLDIAMLYPLSVHVLQSAADVDKDVYDLLLLHLPVVLHDEIK